jgi:hypothetical protein
MKICLLSAITMMLLSMPVVAQETSTLDGNGKSAGIAINPVLLLFEWGSAEVNLWNIQRNAEINIPFQYISSSVFAEEEDNVKEDVRIYTFGAYYRYFFHEKQQGFFAQVGWQYLNAKITNPLEESTGSLNSLLFGFGYRLIAKNGLFWGCGLAAGKAWGKVEDPDGDTRASGFWFDVDLLKFGYAW